MLLNQQHRWKVLAAGVAANVSFSCVVGGIPATAVDLRSRYHLSNSELGLALGILGLGIAVSEIPWGLLTDRWRLITSVITRAASAPKKAVPLKLTATPWPITSTNRWAWSGRSSRGTSRC